jgi:MoaA/NifB/PqqE/SkfB family radical SAM enzyme
MNNFINPPAKLMYHIDRISQIRDGKHPAPVNVEIDLSNRCNLGCAGCHFAHTHTRGPLAHSAKPANMQDVGDLMTYSMALKIIDELAGFGVRSITWTGGGEPTLHPDFDAIVYQAAVAGIPQGIYTNGTQIDANRAELLKQSMTFVYVSLDRADKESYKAYKKTDAFEKACAGIRNLVHAKGTATIGVGFLLSAESVDSVYDMIHLGKDLGADYVQFRPEIDYDVTDASKGPDNTWWIGQVIEDFEGRDIPGVEIDLSRFKMYRDWYAHPYPICYWAQMQTVITPNGKLWTCVNRRGFSGDELGDLNTEGFEDIWKRSKAFTVNHDCRAMCRGHVPNLTLDRMMQQPKGHENFV